MRKSTSVFAALSFLVALPAITLPADVSALPVVQPNAVAGPDLPIEKSAYVHRGRRYCFYQRGWHGPGYYLCRRPYLRGFYLAPRFFRHGWRPYGLRHYGSRHYGSRHYGSRQYGFRHDQRFRSGAGRNQGVLSPSARFGRNFGRNGLDNRTGFGGNRAFRTRLGPQPGRAPAAVTRSIVRQGPGVTGLNGPAVNRGGAGAFSARPGTIGRVGGGMRSGGMGPGTGGGRMGGVGGGGARFGGGGGRAGGAGGAH